MTCTLLIAACLCLAPPGSRAADSPDRPRRILIIPSYNFDYLGIQWFLQGFMAEFTEHKPFKVTFFLENLQLAAHPSDQLYMDNMAASLKIKYAREKPDLIIIQYKQALQFMERYGKKVFGDVPVVFAGLSVEGYIPERLPRNYTGIVASFSASKNIELILRNHPDVKKIYVVGGDGPVERDMVNEAIRAGASYRERVQFVALNGLTFPALLEKLGKAEDDSAVIYQALQLDAAGKVFVPAQAAIEIARAARVPVYGMLDTYMGSGIAGGFLIHHDGLGRRAAEIAMQWLQTGVMPDARVKSEPIGLYRFDGRQLQRWGIREDTLPPGSKVEFRAYSVWDSFKKQILGGVFLILLQAALIIGLWWNRYQRIRTGKELRESEERFRANFERSTIGQSLTAPDGKLLRINRAFADMLGYTIEEIQQINFAQITHPDDVAVSWECTRSLLADEQAAYRMEKRYVRRDGDIVWADVSATLLRDGQGTPLYLITSINDITERKQLAETLQTEKANLDAIFESSPVALFILDETTNIVRVNTAALVLTGGSAAAALQHRPGNALRCVHVSQDPRGCGYAPACPLCPARNSIESLLAKGGEIHGAELKMELMRNGAPEQVWMAIGAETVQLDGRRHVCVAMEDITARKQAAAINTAQLHLIEFAADHSLDELLEETLNEAEKLSGSVIGFYHFVEADQATLTLQNWSTRTKAEFCRAEGKGAHYGIDKAGVWVDCVHQRKPVIHNDYASLPHRKGMPEGHAVVIRQLVVPVMQGERVMAILGVGNKPDDYTPVDVAVVSELAGLAWQIAVRKRAEEALSQSRKAALNLMTDAVAARDRAEQMNKELELNSHRMQVLLQLNQMREATLMETTDFALEEAVRLTQSTIGYLAFLNEDESVLTMHAWSKSAMAECAIIDKPIIYPVDTTGLWGEAVRQRRPVFTNDYAAANPLKKGYPQGHVAVKRHMNVPVFEGSRIVLVAGVGNKNEEYSENDAQQLTLLMEGMWRLIERRRLGEELQESEARLSTIFKNDPTGIFIVNGKTRIIYDVNDSALEVIGLPRGDVVGKVCHRFLCPAETMCCPVCDLGQLVDRSERVLLKPDGTRIPILKSVVPIKLKGEDYLLESFIDITDRKRAEEELRIASLYARNLIETSLDPLLTISADGKIMDVNKTTEQVTGVSREKLIGSDFSDYFTEPDKAREGYKQVFTQGFVKDYSLTIRHSSGRTTDVLYNASVYKNEAGEVQGVFATARDITERKQAEEETKKQLDELFRWHNATLGRESRILDLKREVNELLGKAGDPPRYPSAESQDKKEE